MAKQRKRKYYLRKVGNKRIQVAMPKKHRSSKIRSGNPVEIDYVPTLI